MNSSQFLGQLAALQKPIFTSNDLVKITGKSRNYLKVYIHRLKKRGLLREVEKGKYVLPGQHPLITASHLIFPSYISFLSAYSYYQQTTQLPRVIQVVALRPKRSLTVDNYSIKFITFPPAKVFGYHQEKFQGKTIFIAELEKAIIDSLYLPRYCPLDETYAVLSSEKINVNLLVSCALRLDSIVLLKRLGYLLERRGDDRYRTLGKHLNQRYDLLNPGLPSSRYQARSAKWKLILNDTL